MGPLAGLKIVEFFGLGPTPMTAMLLSDLGATVIKIDRPSPSNTGIHRPTRFNLMARGRSSVIVDLKQAEGIDLILSLLEKADALIEGHRPGTMERLGLGPDVVMARNPRLIYGRMTGWGQEGILAKAAGHDLNYIALSGALRAIGRKDSKPTPPLNLVGDFGGGALYLALGITSAIIERQRSGKGQVIDAAVVDGTASMMTVFYGLLSAGLYSLEHGRNTLDSGSPIYDVYECADGAYISVAAIEEKFQAELFHLLGLQVSAYDRPNLAVLLEEKFRTKTRAEWCEILEGTDACFAPVLSMEEAPLHPQNCARRTFVEIDGVVQPAPAPRFSRTPPSSPLPPESEGASTIKALLEWGIPNEQVDRLKTAGVIAEKMKLASSN
jgi:alpha-methylacyl-CoA racemase